MFLFVRPSRAILSDSNSELVDLYSGLREDPDGVWAEYTAFGDTKDDYHEVRSWRPEALSLTARTARLLYLNRTCFKGNWRHNSKGEFNVGYGGQSRRWVITLDYLKGVSTALKKAELHCSDFETIVDQCVGGDFLFLDPPYKRGERELLNDHYGFKQFSYDDQKRLAAALRRAALRGVTWVLTNSTHRDILSLFDGFSILEKLNSRQEGLGEAIILSQGAK